MYAHDPSKNSQRLDMKERQNNKLLPSKAGIVTTESRFQLIVYRCDHAHHQLRDRQAGRLWRRLNCGDITRMKERFRRLLLLLRDMYAGVRIRTRDWG